MDDSMLRSMGRPHDAVAAADSVRSALEAGFKVCIDLIYGYPGQTTDLWIKTLERAVGLEAHELHLYRLRIKAYGPWPSVIGSMYAADPCAFPSIEETLRMKAAAIAFLARKGYRENLTRVFTRSRADYSRFMENHSSGTLNLLAFGLSASGSFVDRIWVNARDLGMYYSMIETGRLPVADFLERDRDTLTRYAIVLPLKNRGVRKKVFQSLAGVPLDSVFRAKIGRLKDYGLVREDSQSLTLTPLGRFFADEVCHQFHTPDCMPFPRSAYSEGPLNPYNDPMP
jgi:oxygen-independent coproporphyrinogen-3 oxidase